MFKKSFCRAFSYIYFIESESSFPFRIICHTPVTTLFHLCAVQVEELTAFSIMREEGVTCESERERVGECELVGDACVTLTVVRYLLFITSALTIIYLIG